MARPCCHVAVRPTTDVAHLTYVGHARKRQQGRGPAVAGAQRFATGPTSQATTYCLISRGGIGLLNRVEFTLRLRIWPLQSFFSKLAYRHNRRQ